MSIKSRLAKLEKDLLPKDGNNIDVVICEIGETPEQACKRLDIDREDGEGLRIFVVFN